QKRLLDVDLHRTQAANDTILQWRKPLPERLCPKPLSRNRSKHIFIREKPLGLCKGQCLLAKESKTIDSDISLKRLANQVTERLCLRVTDLFQFLSQVIRDSNG